MDSSPHFNSLSQTATPMEGVDGGSPKSSPCDKPLQATMTQGGSGFEPMDISSGSGEEVTVTYRGTLSPAAMHPLTNRSTLPPCAVEPLNDPQGAMDCKSPAHGSKGTVAETRGLTPTHGEHRAGSEVHVYTTKSSRQDIQSRFSNINSPVQGQEICSAPNEGGFSASPTTQTLSPSFSNGTHPNGSDGCGDNGEEQQRHDCSADGSGSNPIQPLSSCNSEGPLQDQPPKPPTIEELERQALKLPNKLSNEHRDKINEEINNREFLKSGKPDYLKNLPKSCSLCNHVRCRGVVFQ